MIKSRISVTAFHTRKEVGFVWGDARNAEIRNKNRKQYAEEIKTNYELNYHANLEEGKREMSEEDCPHDWVYSPFVLLSNPPIRKRICKNCGKMEEERGDYIDPSEYDRTVEKFIDKVGAYKSVK